MSKARCVLRIGGKAGRQFMVILSRSWITSPRPMVNMRMAGRMVRSARASTSKSQDVRENRVSYGTGRFTRRTDVQTAENSIHSNIRILLRIHHDRW